MSFPNFQIPQPPKYHFLFLKMRCDKDELSKKNKVICQGLNDPWDFVIWKTEGNKEKHKYLKYSKKYIQSISEFQKKSYF